MALLGKAYFVIPRYLFNSLLKKNVPPFTFVNEGAYKIFQTKRRAD